MTDMTKDMMKDMALRRPNTPLIMEERPVPSPAAGEVRLRVEACGVCRTDLHVVDGELTQPKLPIIPGQKSSDASRRSAPARPASRLASGSAFHGLATRAGIAPIA